MLTGISGFISGVILLYFCPDLINSSLLSLKYAGFLIASVCVLAIAGLIFIKQRFRIIICPGAGLVLGLCYASYACLQLKEATLPEQYENKTLFLSGYLCDLPRASDFSHSAEFCVTGLRTESGSDLPGSGYKALLRWPLDVRLDSGVQVLQVSARQPRAGVNFVGFPYEANLFYKEVILSAKVRQVLPSDSVSNLKAAQKIQYYYYQSRLFLASFSDQLLEGTIHHGMIRALLLGDRSRLSVSDHKLLSETGTQHLIAISGLHVGIVMLGLYFLFPKSLVYLLLVAVLGAVYVLLVGFGPSAQRAWVMSLLGLVYAAGYLKQGRWQTYLLALFLVLLIDPLAPLNLGFWFSFVCVAILIVITQNMNMRHRPWLALCLLQLWVMLGLAPLYSYLGLPNGLVNVFANLMAVPWISILVLPCVLISFLLALICHGWAEVIFPLVKVLFLLVDISLELLMAFLDSLSIFHSVWLFEAKGMTVLFYLLAFLFLLLLLRFTSVVSVALPALFLTLLCHSRMQDSLHQVIVFDAGQGLALAMSFDDQTWLYDTGPSHNRFSTVEQIILPYLRSRRVEHKISGLIVSHGDADHAGDLSSLLKAIAIPQLISGEPERLDASRRFFACRSGSILETKNASIEVLYPFNVEGASADKMENLSSSMLSANNRSCVVRFNLAGKIFLLMGDLEGEAELALVRHYRHYLKSDVLIAGHHGASKGTSYALLKHVQPEYVVFSAGYLNPFGHPSSDVLERVRHFPAKTLNTAMLGALSFGVDLYTQALLVEGAREMRTAFWLNQVPHE